METASTVTESGLFIDGQWIGVGERESIPVEDPATRTVTSAHNATAEVVRASMLGQSGRSVLGNPNLRAWENARSLSRQPAGHHGCGPRPL